MHYKYKILHVPTGNYIAVCYSDAYKINRLTRVSQWLQDLDIDAERISSTSGICGFFLCSEFSKDNDVPDLVLTSKKQGERLIQNYNFRFDITMDFYFFGKRTELLAKIKNNKNFSLALPNEFEVIRVESKKS